MKRRLIDVRELSEWLGVATGTLYNWVSYGRLPHTKLGRCLRFDPDEIDKWLDRAKLVEADKR